jgi:UDP-N-acetylmuramoyl-tripeptide--D-alanyl-D-alanine ligase
MNGWTMRDVAALANGRLLGDGEVSVTGLSIDTRTLKRGDLYVAIRGRRLDGHAFVRAAVKRDASGVVADHPLPTFGRPLVVVDDTTKALGVFGRSKRLQWDGPLAAVTGSVGKTTVKDLLAHLLGRAVGRSGKVLATRGNLNNCYGLPLTLFGLGLDVDAAVVELGINHPAEMARPDVAVVTRIGDAHGGNFAGRAQVAKEKTMVLGSLRKDGVAVLNHDDPFLRKASRVGRTVWFGLEGGDVTARGIRITPEGTAFTLVAGGKGFKTSVALLGSHHVANALAAVAAAEAFGVPIAQAARDLASFRPVSRMRMELVQRRGVCFVNDAYNASPDSTRAALETFSLLPAKGRKVAVLGDMRELGRLAPSAHRSAVEEALVAGVDVLLLVGQEMPMAWGRLFGIVPGLEAGVEAVRSSDGRRTTVRSCADAKEAGGFLKKELRGGDLVLLKASRGVGLEKALETFEGK